MRHTTGSDVRRGVPALVLLATAALAAGCGSDEPEADDPTTTSSTSQTGAPATEEPTEEAETEPTEDVGTVIEVRIAGGEVSPRGERVEAAAGEPIAFEIDSDIAGEIHVHGNPEQLLEFEPGTSTQEITLDQPGVVEAELHEPETLLVQLEVR